MHRGGRSDGELTARRIVETAGALFAAHGFAETSSKAVAREAGVALTSINYHFGSRSGLYQAALSEAHRRMISLSELREIDACGLPAANKVTRLIDTLVAAAGSETGWAARMVAREVLAPSSHLHVLWTEDVQPKVTIVLRFLSEVTGIPLGDPALVRCLLSVVAPCLLLIVAGPGVPGPVHTVRNMAKDELATHLRSFSLAGLAAISKQRIQQDRPPTRKGRHA
jgi:AcrR family transcriptional regulator